MTGRIRTRAHKMIISTALCLSLLLAPHHAQELTAEYGVDVSWPMHNDHVSQNFAWLQTEGVDGGNSTNTDAPISHLPERQQIYEDYINGCVEYYGEKGYLCRSGEKSRISMSLRQPKSMTNYTDVGFKKIKAPPDLMEMLVKFWEDNKELEYREEWPVGNVYTNHWKSPTAMVSVENDELIGGGYDLKRRLWDAAQDSLEEWTGQKLRGSSLYGIRIYKEGSILSTHVDRMPLISSCIINVAQDVDEDWPIEVIGHDGKAHNITMEPGDMVLYESHSVLHGRPFALKGRYYANVFIHFEPILGDEKSQRSAEKRREREEMMVKQLEETHPDDLPIYIREGTAEANNWRVNNPKYSRREQMELIAKEDQVDSILHEDQSITSAHVAAKNGELNKIKRHSDSFLHQVDENGWGPVHEAARKGFMDIVVHLHERGVSITQKTEGGHTAKDLVEYYHGSDHELFKWLANEEEKMMRAEL